MSSKFGDIEVNLSGIAYIAMVVLSMIFIVVGFLTHNSADLMFSVPVFCIGLIFLEKKNRHLTVLSVKMCLIIIIMMFLAHFSDFYLGADPRLTFLSDFILGLMLALASIIAVKTMLRNAPELDKGRPFFVSFTSFCIAVTMSQVLRFGSLFIDRVWSGDLGGELGLFLGSVLGSILGALAVCAVYYIHKKTGIFGKRGDKLFASQISPEDEEVRRNGVLELISQGESFTLEFKSTLRTNLVTGEKDPRMEKAVLKTIVAFLNSRGGTLLIGVSDAGETVGADEASFENRDRMLLHLNHLIEDKIGKEFIPFINYYIVPIDEVIVIRVDCRMSDAPVFLTEGKEQTFYVRSGPSSIDLHGMALLQYANRNFGRIIKRSAIGVNNEP